MHRVKKMGPYLGLVIPLLCAYEGVRQLICNVIYKNKTFLIKSSIIGKAFITVKVNDMVAGN
jgi:hypothetical protein